MSYHLGRLIDHVGMRVADMEAARRFYRAVLAAIGHENAIGEDDVSFWCDELYIGPAGPEGPTRIHLCFQAGTEEQVRAFHAAGLEAGGRDNGPPGRRDYHAQYYAAFLLDPDGNNVEALCEAPLRRSAPSIEVTRTGPGAAPT